MFGMNNILLFSLIAMRVSGFILFNPILGRKNIPAIVKTGIILALSFIIISYEINEPVEAENAVVYALLLIKGIGVRLCYRISYEFVFVCNYPFWRSCGFADGAFNVKNI